MEQVKELALEMAKLEHKLQYERSPKGMMHTWEELNQSKRDWWVGTFLPFAELALKFTK